ncbi:MAG: hypothetical protein WA883_17620 [Phormidesmis sp.]
MSQEVAVFLGSVVLLIGYLIFSAKTEMGTKMHLRWPRQSKR